MSKKKTRWWWRVLSKVSADLEVFPNAISFGFSRIYAAKRRTNSSKKFDRSFTVRFDALLPFHHCHTSKKYFLPVNVARKKHTPRFVLKGEFLLKFDSSQLPGVWLEISAKLQSWSEQAAVQRRPSKKIKKKKKGKTRLPNKTDAMVDKQRSGIWHLIPIRPWLIATLGFTAAVLFICCHVMSESSSCLLWWRMLKAKVLSIHSE